MANVETVVYKGIAFRRYPDSKNRSDRVYYTPGSADRARGVLRLHQEVWRDLHGPIPPGHVIHHRDNDASNNDPANLEAVPRAAHQSYHGKQHPPGKAHLDAIRPLADHWHRSEAGRAWHRDHARRTLGPPAVATYTCAHCGVAFESTTHVAPGRARYCSAAHAAAARRASGLDDVERTCTVCGVVFRINRFRKTTTCSRRCGASRRRRSAP